MYGAGCTDTGAGELGARSRSSSGSSARDTILLLGVPMIDDGLSLPPNAPTVLKGEEGNGVRLAAEGVRRGTCRNDEAFRGRGVMLGEGD